MQHLSIAQRHKLFSTMSEIINLLMHEITVQAITFEAHMLMTSEKAHENVINLRYDVN